MALQSTTISGTIDASREHVWEVIASPEQAAGTMPSISAVEMLTTGPYDVGTRWRETRTMMGRTETHVLEVSESVPLQRTVVSTSQDGVDYHTTLRLSPDGAGTRLAISFSGDQPRATRARQLLVRLVGPVGAAMTRRMLRREWEEIRAAVLGTSPH